jgi:hypothetical protein
LCTKRARAHDIIRLWPERSVSARCHEERANLLTRNLMRDIVQGAEAVEEARACCATEFLDFLGSATPYMERLHIDPAGGGAADPDVAIISDEQLAQAVREGEGLER